MASHVISNKNLLIRYKRKLNRILSSNNFLHNIINNANSVIQLSNKLKNNIKNNYNLLYENIEQHIEDFQIATKLNMEAKHNYLKS